MNSAFAHPNANYNNKYMLSLNIFCTWTYTYKYVENKYEQNNTENYYKYIIRNITRVT